MNGSASNYPKLVNVCVCGGGALVIPGTSSRGHDLPLNPRKNQFLRASPPTIVWNLFDSLEQRVPAKTSVAQPWVCKEKSDRVLLGTQETVVPSRVGAAP